MTGQQQPSGAFDPRQSQVYVQQQPAPVKKKKVRVFTWIILAINLLFLIWLIAGITSVSTAKCDGLTQQNCDAAKAIGGGIGSLLVIFLWVAADVILGIIWLVTRKKEPTVIYVQQPPVQR